MAAAAGGTPTTKRADAPLHERIIRIYCDATQYPEDVFELDADLEADLGIDSVKQGQILAHVQNEFGLPHRDDVVLANYRTLRKVVEMVQAAPHKA
jgi:acyl carrier protein